MKHGKALNLFLAVLFAAVMLFCMTLTAWAYSGTKTSEGEAQIQRPLTITAIDRTYTYNGGTQGPGGAHIEPAQIADTVTVGGTMDPGDELADLIVGGQGDAAGDYALTPSAAVIENNGQDVTDHYAITYVPGKMTITPKQMNITVNGSGAEKTYNGKEQTVTGTVTAASSDAVFDASRFSYSGSVAASGKNAGEYTTALSAGKCAYSDKSCKVSWTIGDPVRLTIQPKDVTIKAQDKEFYNDGLEHSWPKYDVDGLIGDDKIEAVVTGSIRFVTENPVANKVVSFKFTKGEPKNYNVILKDGKLTIIELEPKPPEPTSKPEPVPTPEKKVSGTLMSKMTAKGSRSLVLTWNEVDGADGYDVFFAICKAETKYKKVKTLRGNDTLKWTKNRLKKETSYKAYVRAWVNKDGVKTYVKSSPKLHAYTGGGNSVYTNPKSVTVKKQTVSLKTRETFKIEAKVDMLQKGKELIPKQHIAPLRYISSNKEIATVTKSGKIRANAPGKCKVYVYAANGVRKTVKVTVKAE